MVLKVPFLEQAEAASHTLVLMVVGRQEGGSGVQG